LEEGKHNDLQSRSPDAKVPQHDPRDIDISQLLAGVHTLAECAHILVEPAGAAALAGVFAHREDIRGKRIVLILTGANITIAQLEQAMATPPLFSIDTLPQP
jgi:threonine dehydratase